MWKLYRVYDLATMNKWMRKVFEECLGIYKMTIAEWCAKQGIGKDNICDWYNGDVDFDWENVMILAGRVGAILRLETPEKPKRPKELRVKRHRQRIDLSKYEYDIED